MPYVLPSLALIPASLTAEPVDAPHTSSSSPAAYDDQHEHDLKQSGGSGSIGDTLHGAKETTVSGASVAVLILWTIAVTGWTGFQVCCYDS